MTKTHILEELKRTAEANGGVPLGWYRFSAETGIRLTDLNANTFARYSDACREAGYAANTLTKAYDAEELLEKYANLAKSIGRLPAKGDMRVKAADGTGFPHDKTLTRALGSKPEQIRKLLDYCRNHSGYEDVIRLCENYNARGQKEPTEIAPSENEIGFVYLMKSGRFHKIGKSNAAGRREYELRIQLPERLATIHTIRTDDPSGIEAYWHKRFAEKRRNGEWFELNAADVATFKRRKFM